MLLSIALILLSGLSLGWICEKIKLPRLVGMILAGIILGPYVLNYIDAGLLEISGHIRKIALIIILLRAGITLNVNDLKKVGRPAVLMCFLPACFEIAGMVLLAPMLLGVGRLDAAIMGAVVAAVSPAVIVPRMIKLIENKYGTDKSIPQLILAGASVDDVFVIVVFYSFISMASGGSLSAFNFVKIPVSILCGILLGVFIGMALNFYFSKVHVRDTVKLIIILSISFILVSIEDKYGDVIYFSALIAIMTMAMTIRLKREIVASRLSIRLNKMWVVAEIFLFVLVGCFVKPDSAAKYGVMAVALILLVLIFRLFGVIICVIGTNLNTKEKIFCGMAYMPKATVQAAIGGIPLTMGLECGDVVLTVAVLAILITAPLGAFLIDMTYKKLLTKVE